MNIFQKKLQNLNVDFKKLDFNVNFLSILFRYLQFQYKYIEKLIKYNKYQGKTDHSIINHNPFISENTVKHIQKLKDSISYSANYNSNTIHIIVYNNDTKYANKLIKQLITIFFVIVELRGYKNIQINTSIWLTYLKKKINYNQDFIGKDEVNSAVSSFKHKIHNNKLDYNNDNIGEIFIWRKEEVKKVFIHELLHSLNFDFFHYPNDLKHDFLTKFPLDMELDLFRIGESYVETWACVLNCLLICVMKNYKFNKFTIMIKDEIKFSLLQIAKILNFYKFNCIDKCVGQFRNKDGKNKLSFKQETSVFSYYFIKSCLLFNLEKFIYFCVFHNNRLLIFNQENLNLFHKFILNSIESKSYNKHVSLLIKNLKEKDKKNYLFNNLRMSFYE